MTEETPKPIRKIMIENHSGIGHQTRVIDAETGQELHMIQRVEVLIDVNQPVRAILHCTQVETDLSNVPVDSIITTHVAPNAEPWTTIDTPNHEEETLG